MGNHRVAVLTLGEVLAEAAARFGNRVAVAPDGGEPVTYAELHAAAGRAAGGLRALGVGRGDVVALALPSSVEYLVAYLAAATLGAVTAGVNPRLARPQRDRVLAVAAPALIVGTREDVHGLARQMPAAPSAEPDDPVTIVFTSGTTGTPKGATFTHRHLDAIRRLDVGDAAWGSGGPLLVSTELAHVGAMTKLGWYLRLGCTLHLLAKWRAADALRVVSANRISQIGGIAPQIALLLRRPDFDDYDLSAVTTIVAGGAPSPPALVAEAQRRFGATYSVRYSSTESGGVGTADGVPRPGVEVDLRDGEVWLRSPAVMAGYWRNPEATAAVLPDGWLRTGDLGEWDADGRLRILGRADDVYLRGGYNVHPEAVEAVLREHPAVADVAIVPRPDDVMGSIGVAVVVPRDGAVPTLDGLRSFAAGRLARHELPEALAVVPDLPRNAGHKVDRPRLLRNLTGDQNTF